VDSAREYPDLALYRRLAALARPYRPHLAALVVLSLLATPLALLLPVPLKIAVDSALGSHPLPGFIAAVVPGGTPSHDEALVIAIALLVMVAVLTQLQQFAVAVLSSYTGERLLMRLRAVLFRQVQRLSLAYHDARGTADSTYRIQYDATSIQWIAVTGLIPVIEAGFMLAGMLYVTARIDWQLALVAMVCAPVLFALISFYKPRLRRGWRSAKELESSAMAVVQEVLTGLRLVKAFGQEEREQHRFVARSTQGMSARIRLSAVEGLFGLLIGLATAAGTAVVLYVGVRHVQSGRITLGELLVVMGYLAQLYVPVQTLSRQVGKVQAALASAERVFRVIDQEPDVPERRGARALPRATGGVEFRAVTFAYAPGREALDDISFEVAPGRRVGIAGRTGSGKSTLASLLMRFYDPAQGQILLDGVDLRDYRVADLRNQFALVLQDPILFSTSILENIAYARPDAQNGEIVAAARAADAHDFIMRLPDGYDTIVGERGATLSGGERQRISLARAFLKDAPILVLDEPTSSVDVGTEAAIMRAMDRLMAGRTTFMIAHRLQTLASCDVRLEIEDGRLATGAPRAAARGGGGQPSADAVPPEVVELARQVIGGDARLVADARLARSVHRVTFDIGSRRASVVVKRLSRRIARATQLLAQRWLPAVALGGTCPQVRGMLDEPRGAGVWHVYEDVGGAQLDCRRPDPDLVSVVVTLIAEVHARFSGHALLSECRSQGRDLGIGFFTSEVSRCVDHLAALASPGRSLPAEHVELAERLLSRLERLYGERDERARLFECFGGDDTLLHGDLWTTNTLVVERADGAKPMLIDWDHVGVGPVAYDLSTFLYRFAPDERVWILRAYRQAAAERGRELPGDGVLNRLFETAEDARYACCLAEAALAARRGERWGFEQMAEIDDWFARLEPVLAIA
jgi:ATP-binding cassette, subfamily B, bacterial